MAFTVQPSDIQRTLRTRSPNIRTLRAPQVDFSLFETFRIYERINLQLRAEAFNLTNSPWFVAPNNKPGGSSFGVVSSAQANDSRNAQLALKLVF